MNRTLEQWIDRYNKKIPEGFKRDKRFALFYLPDKGFAEIMNTGNMIVVNQLCGEFKFWRKVAERLAQQCGYTHAGTICIRNIEAYIRMAGFVPYDIEYTVQGDRYFCKDKHTGQKGQASPAGEGTYYITWEVTANELPI